MANLILTLRNTSTAYCCRVVQDYYLNRSCSVNYNELMIINNSMLWKQKARCCQEVVRVPVVGYLCAHNIRAHHGTTASYIMILYSMRLYCHAF